ncbi:isopentenyl-diphosphate delta-isomerase [Salsuginibacillus halophilus]|uniref:Isopentenyl-diphosphate delta-isomerase n=1 Tax=Salsuginibacillus halophilus TaxID=517424 RepID=A0A2P8HW74_9BACI|nr:type 2 isopentenyl-diphosphate Delta-isomerase [Salsuginibacillus halophilus]PSL50479.1 isopentenyl-diphosphate delta-isomerase [Salsuginibacillus halophilus]
MSRAERKRDHIAHAVAGSRKETNGFEDVRFVHTSLPEIAFNDVDISTTIGGLHLSSPIVVNAMTGGGGEETEKINRSLARACQMTGLPMAVGSQMAALKDTKERRTYEVVRETYPEGLLFANLGSEAEPEQAKQAVDMIAADALQIHLNPIQELVMPEGDRDFRGTVERLRAIKESVSVPLIVKEVGFGISHETAGTLASIGVEVIDTGGNGGTNFAAIENVRRDEPLTFFESWGLSTAASVIEARSGANEADIIASGGIRNAEDVGKAVALGANACGMAGRILEAVKSGGVDAAVESINRMHGTLRYLMTAVGAKDLHELQQAPLVVQGSTHHWLSERGLR